MQVDWRIGLLIVIAVVAIILLAGTVAGRSRLGTGTDDGARGSPALACPPGHVTNEGCTKP